MNTAKHLYEMIFVLHPELTEEEVETHIQSVVKFLEGKGSEILRVDRGGKRRLAYPVRKQRYGYYNLLHFRAIPELPAELERSFRLNERVVRYLTVRFEKEEQLTGLTRLVDDDGRDEERDDRRRGGRRGEPFRPRSYTQGIHARSERARALEDDDDEGFADAAEQVAEETN